MTPAEETPSEQINRLFGLYKAEWLDEQLFDLFTEPEYFGELRTERPCVLIGGRGTGKTTVLRGLSYQGQFVLCGSDPAQVRLWPFYGLYHRVNTNRVTAFRGPELEEGRWAKCFAHYMNLVFCSDVLAFLHWYGARTLRPVELPETHIARVCASLNIARCSSLDQLSEGLSDARVAFEAAINNVADASPTGLSLQGAPVDELTDAIVSLPEFSGKKFFFLIDEYENLDDYQQKVLNTVIKHAKPGYTFKIGVRELGWRVRATLNANEQLTHPADYVRINIGDELTPERFVQFASAVCNGRLGRVELPHGQGVPRIEDLFPALSPDDEAIRLGVGETNRETLAEVAADAAAEELAWARALPPTKLFLVHYWAQASGQRCIDVVREAMANQASWETRHGNYQHAALFAIRRGKRGIRKFYCGWEVLALLASGNIRYMLELVHASFLNHFDGEGTVLGAVSAEDQTRAAQAVGRKYFDELEGISIDGARLTKLLLGLGRVFQVLAETPEGHTPEVNQFHLKDAAEPPAQDDADRLLHAAVMHLALVRSTGSKLVDKADTREYDYMAHPIYAPFFGFSHRRKRKLKLTVHQLLGLVSDHHATIREVLRANNRSDEVAACQVVLPDQLLLFEGYYCGDQ